MQLFFSPECRREKPRKQQIRILDGSNWDNFSKLQLLSPCFHMRFQFVEWKTHKSLHTPLRRRHAALALNIINSSHHSWNPINARFPRWKQRGSKPIAHQSETTGWFLPKMWIISTSELRLWQHRNTPQVAQLTTATGAIRDWSVFSAVRFEHFC